MAAKNGAGVFLSESGSLVDGLALSVISRINAAPHTRRNRRIDVGAKILLSEVLEHSDFDQEAVREDLASLRISRTDIVDHCIPMAAAELGLAWIDNRLSWAQVSVGSAKLYSLCKAVSQPWDNIRPPMSSRAILLATIERESHVIGPAVVADQLRRRGHSVQLHSNGSAESILSELGKRSYDGVFISVSSGQTLESTVRHIRSIQRAATGLPVILGGSALSHNGARLENTGADLVTNDIEEALDAVSGNDISLRVAE